MKQIIGHGDETEDEREWENKIDLWYKQLTR